ncbi:ankyrin repeat protein [Tahibacter aquaticus]|uniref:Ankyrin repeat protein n=1 Tax=Tahibacter aquaticus TaxID=520092 RepID=A0A4R6YKC8_9GAMM|nr:ankyrin repeat domain-containing protein [Tahibacter aquaticus]TDR37395.1 ankyrin repeat protein [Tahibacter aquaticus]
MQRILLAAALSCLSLAALAKRGPSASDLVKQVEAKVEQGTVDPARDFAPLFDGLRAAKDDSTRATYVDAIAELGEARGSSPAAVKTWLLDNAPPLLLEVARSDASWSVRGDALMALRALDAPDAVLDEAIALAKSATGEASGFIHSRGELLQDWKDNRVSHGARPATAKPADAQKEQAALEFLRARNVGASSDALGQALVNAQPDIVQALIDAGVDVKAPGPAGLSSLGTATMVACAKKNALERQLAVIDLLLANGADIKQKDAQGNSVLIGAVQSCPLPIIEKLVAGGAEPDPVNAQQFTPLKMAFVGGHWDIAEFLVGKGARLTAKEADQLFFEKPQDPKQAAILAKAIKPAK